MAVYPSEPQVASEGTTLDLSPCARCGSKPSRRDEVCRMCSYDLRAGTGQAMSGQSTASPQPELGRCGRCGSEVSQHSAFCQICGLELRLRPFRPDTQSLSIRRLESPSNQNQPVSAKAGKVHGGGVGAQAVPGHQSFREGKMEAASSDWPAVSQTAAVEFMSPNVIQGWLIAVGRDGRERERYALRSEPLVLGREGAVSFVGDEYLSDFHASVESIGEGRIRVRDLNSKNGLYIRVETIKPVAPGSHFLAGQHLLRLDAITRSPTSVMEHDLPRSFGTPLPRAWGRIVVIEGDGSDGDSHLLRQPEIVIGREHGAVTFPDDPYLSRRHMRLRATVDGRAMEVHLEDLASINGTFLRESEAEIGDGGMFRIGDQIIRFRRST